jgi:hypothetical protein
MQHRTRDLTDRLAQLINALRAHMSELGIAAEAIRDLRGGNGLPRLLASRHVTVEIAGCLTARLGEQAYPTRFIECGKVDSGVLPLFRTRPKSSISPAFFRLKPLNFQPLRYNVSVVFRLRL